jgi:hypothetical protein
LAVSQQRPRSAANDESDAGVSLETQIPRCLERQGKARARMETADPSFRDKFRAALAAVTHSR